MRFIKKNIEMTLKYNLALQTSLNLWHVLNMIELLATSTISLLSLMNIRKVLIQITVAKG